MRKEKIYDEDLVNTRRKATSYDEGLGFSRRKEKSYDERFVPSRLAEHYTNFGWIRSRNKVNEELDRKAKGIYLTPAQDKEYIEPIRRKKRFGYNMELVSLERSYMKCISGPKQRGKGAGFLLFLGILFLLAAIFCAVFTFVPKYPTSVAEYNNLSSTQKAINDIGLQINGALFYGDQYYVKDTEVDKSADKAGATTVTVSKDLSVVYKLDADGQLQSTELAELKDKFSVDENGNVKILRVEKATLDPKDEDSAYYRYYVYYDTAKAPLGFISSITNSLPSALANGMIVFLALALILAIIFLISGSCLKAAKKNPRYVVKSIVARAAKIIEDMRMEDPGLMTKSQRHFYSWQRIMTSAINMSNVGKNDNSGADSDENDFDY